MKKTTSLLFSILLSFALFSQFTGGGKGGYASSKNVCVAMDNTSSSLKEYNNDTTGENETDNHTVSATDIDLFAQITSAVNLDKQTNIVSFNVTIQNGTKDALPNSFVVAYYASKDTVLDNDDIMFSSLEITPSLMAFGKGYYYTDISLGLVTGNWYILVVVDVNNSIQEKNENNNIISTEMITVGTVSINEENTSCHALLLNSYPNPLQTVTYIAFYLPQKTHVALSVTDITGKEIAKLLDEEMSSGEHIVSYDSSLLPSGIYFSQLKTNDETVIYKLIK